MERAPTLPSTSPAHAVTPPLAAQQQGVRARLWVSPDTLFVRESAQAYVWLWLLRADGALRVWRLPRVSEGDDDLLVELAWRADDDPAHDAWRLPLAPVVPVPRWSVSWGHPMARAVQAFAAALDDAVLNTLGGLEQRGAYFGCAENYSRLAVLKPTVRAHRLQALTLFPPLVAPLLLLCPERPEVLDPPSADDPPPSWHASPEVLDAIDRGRDLVLALAHYWGVTRGVVRLPLMRQPWRALPIPRKWLWLPDALPPHARPRTDADWQAWEGHLRALPVRWRSRGDADGVARGLGPDRAALWTALRQRWPHLDLVLRDVWDFLRAAHAHAAVQRGGVSVLPSPETLRRLDRQSERELQGALAFWSAHALADRGVGRRLRTAVAGLLYRPGRYCLARLGVGDAVHLVREPDNSHDPLAVRIDWGDVTLGYIPRRVNRDVAEALDAGVPLRAWVDDVDPALPAHEQVAIVVAWPESTAGEGALH
ncbi:MAG: HIRAN domain-containing protein [Tepidimonas taiwanensis]|nr:HIRAN domain-containing protein [Tepidimonas taiwanensis]